MIANILVLCMCCGKVMKEGVRDSNGGCSHGCCNACLIENYGEFYSEEEKQAMRESDRLSK